jgi:hypothetical protein
MSPIQDPPIDPRLTPEMLATRLNALFAQPVLTYWSFKRSDDALGVIVTPVVTGELVQLVICVYVRDQELEPALALARSHLACSCKLNAGQQITKYWSRDEPSIVVPCGVAPVREIAITVGVLT